jgi:hypothetical protein
MPKQRVGRLVLEEPVRDLSRIVVDWRAYFHEFTKVHGEPILFRGKLLFRDGWQYAQDYKGPEWGPPEEPKELAKLVSLYYKHRLAILTRKQHDLKELLHDFEQAQSIRKIPLYHKVIVVDDEGRRMRQSQPIAIKEWQDQVKWLDRDMQECNDRIAEAVKVIESKPTESSNATPQYA